MITELFKQLKNGLEGYWEDSLNIDRIMIERNNCPKCRKKLIYKGFSNPVQYKAFGICEPCEFAKLFWTEPVVFVKKKKRFSSGEIKSSTERAA